MTQDSFTDFSGVAGRVLRNIFSWETLATGFSLGFLLVVVMFVLGLLKAPNVAVFAVQFLLAASMARFAVNGLYGEWRGTVFSSAGGPWTQVMIVAGRYLFLSFAWLVPLFFMGLNRMAPQQMMLGPSPGGRGTMFVMAVYIFLSTLTPPLFLIAAVSADDFAEFLSTGHWRRLFSGRTTDLFMVYAAYTGALGMLAFLGIPVLLAAVSINWKLMALAAVFLGAFFLGLMATLMGRLCGFFAYGDFRPSGQEIQPTRMPGPSSDASGPRSFAGETAGGPASIPVSQAASTFAGAGDVTGGLPVLDDVRSKIQEADRKFKSDPDSAIAFLEQIREDYAPHPQVLHALTLMNYRTSRKEEAIACAKEALPLCFDRGAVPLAAEIFRTLWPLRTALDLDRDQVLKIAGALSRSNDLTYAANSFALILQQDATDARAIKGIMHVAETLVHERNQPSDAVKLYSYLLKTSGGSPLAEYIQEGLNQAQKAAAVARAS